MAPLKGGEDWDFWGKWERGEWEPETRAVLERFLTSESAYIDIGAWIGPTVRWAVPLCKRVVAVEPDPFAFDLLAQNTADLANVSLISAALVGCRQATVALFCHERWGDSMSSIQPSDKESKDVPALLLPDIWDDACALVKVDIEGGESDVLPDIGPFLRERGVPLYLSVHGPWTDTQIVNKELDQFTSVEVHADNQHGFYEVLCR